MSTYRLLPLGGMNVGASCYLYELGKTRILIDCEVQPGLLAEKSLPRLELSSGLILLGCKTEYP